MSWHHFTHKLGQQLKKHVLGDEGMKAAKKIISYGGVASPLAGLSAIDAAAKIGHSIKKALNQPQDSGTGTEEEKEGLEEDPTSEYLEQMSEYMRMMQETMSQNEPATEPLKSAPEAMNAARNDTARKQLLRRGLMSTMTRYGTPSGTRTKLGA